MSQATSQNMAVAVRRPDALSSSRDCGGLLFAGPSLAFSAAHVPGCTLPTIRIDLSHMMLIGRDPPIRILPKHSRVRASGYDCNAVGYHLTERMSERLDGQGKHVTYATLGLNDTRHTRISLKLASKPKNLHIYAAVEHVFMNARCLQEVLSAEWSLWRIEERDQECVLPLRQRDWSATRVCQASRAAI